MKSESKNRMNPFVRDFLGALAFLTTLFLLFYSIDLYANRNKYSVGDCVYIVTKHEFLEPIVYISIVRKVGKTQYLLGSKTQTFHEYYELESDKSYVNSYYSKMSPLHCEVVGLKK